MPVLKGCTHARTRAHSTAQKIEIENWHPPGRGGGRLGGGGGRAGALGGGGRGGAAWGQITN